MKSKTSLVNRTILRNDLKSYAWVGLVYLLGLLFTVPINLYFLYNNSEYNYLPYIDYYRVLNFNDFSYFFIVVIPVLAGMLLFRYLQSGKAADMTHSLPIKRETFYNTHVLAGLIILITPLLLTALVTWLMIGGLPINLSPQDVWGWLGIAVLINILLFMTSVAVGMITGMTSVQGVLSYILLLLPTGLSLLLFENIGIFTYGFAADLYSSKIEFSPLLRLADFWSNPILNSEIIIYLLLSILLFGLGRYLYKRRQLERAGDALAFDILYPLFKYGVAFCGMLLLGAYFYMQLGSLSWTFLAYSLGSLLAYLLVVILYEKSIYVFNLKTFKGYGVFALTMVVLIAALQFDFAGYEKKMPAIDEIENVYLHNGFYLWDYQSEQTTRSEYETAYPLIQPIYKDKNNIATIHALHKDIIANREQNKAARLGKYYEHYERISLAYTLKNGRHVYRQYAVPRSQYEDHLAAIYESPETKHFRHDVLQVRADEVNLIEIQPMYLGLAVNISAPEQIREAINVLQNEVLQQSYADMTDNRDPWAGITVITKDRHEIYLHWSKSFTDFEDWLKANGQHDLARINPERDLNYAIIVNKASATEKQPTNTRDRGNQQLLQEWENTAGSIKITDSAQLEQCLQKYVRDAKQAYRIMFVLKSGTIIEGDLAEKDLPPAL